MKKALIISTILLLSTTAFADNITGPNITLRSTATTVVAGQSARVTVTVSESLLRFGSDQISVDGGTIESIRKLSPVSYTLFIRVADNTRTLDVIVEASKVQNQAKVYNEYSSNNLILKVTQPAPAATGITPASSITSTISSLLDTITKNVATKPAAVTTTPAPVQQAPVQQAPVYTNPNQYQPAYTSPYSTPYSTYNNSYNANPCIGYDPYYSRYNAYCESQYYNSYNSYTQPVYTSPYDPYPTPYYTTTPTIFDYFDW